MSGSKWPLATVEPAELGSLKVALIENRELRLRTLRSNVTSMIALAEEAFRHHAAGDVERRNDALSAAIDIECNDTGDASILGQLAESWGIDVEDVTVDPDSNPYTLATLPPVPDQVPAVRRACPNCAHLWRYASTALRCECPHCEFGWDVPETRTAAATVEYVRALLEGDADGSKRAFYNHRLLLSQIATAVDAYPEPGAFMASEEQ